MEKKMIDIVFASNNKGKYDELKEDFAKENINLIFNGHLDLKEDDETLLENAIAKAVQAAQQTNMMALGDDSGLFVEELDYMPGLYSRRWLGDEGDDSLRNKELLSLLGNETNRDAYLISRFALVDTDGNLIEKDFVKNKFYVGFEEKGANGFGYDKILIPSEDMRLNCFNKFTKDCFSKEDRAYTDTIYFLEKINGKTIAELSQYEKNKICDRGRIATKFASALKEKQDDLS